MNWSNIRIFFRSKDHRLSRTSLGKKGERDDDDIAILPLEAHMDASGSDASAVGPWPN
ncbi:hypothetical protein PILCRDRAFT_819442 [Piloderma croceum F 1598]|uniref:Uncharacterized protein n=1 Tax=Piloderma croceum (strain F 1598) TaxID=765440 RepID=A0A0C3BAA6_PILCF|nr:hypothetical protein PILCRDRAFT_819442 [Piloderma croceum F 1598]